MKFSVAEDIEDYKKAIGVGVVKGIGAGALVSLGLATYLRRRTSFFSGAGGYQKVFVWVAPAAFMGITSMESASRSFEDHQRRKQHGIADSPAHSNVNMWDATSEFMSRNKYKFVVAGWAASMGGSFYLVNRDKYMTKAQKVVQARVYAQGLTVLMLLATVFMSVSKGSEADIEKQKKQIASNSWERDIGFVSKANHGLEEKVAAAGQTQQRKKTNSADQDKKTDSDRILHSKKPDLSETSAKPEAGQEQQQDNTSESQNKKPEASQEKPEAIQDKKPEASQEKPEASLDKKPEAG